MALRLTIPVSPQFNFWRTVYSHGWCTLLPFRVVKETSRFQMALEMSPNMAVSLDVLQESRSNLTVHIEGKNSLPSAAKREIVSRLKMCFRLDEDMSEFYAAARKHRSFRWIPRFGAGRLLRTPTVFEDVVKMMCTTNCSWSLTEIMVENLCRKLGKEVGDGQFTFPRPEAVADATERFLRKEIRAGYRAPYLLELARRVAGGDLDLESWRQSELPTDTLYEEVHAVKGIGPYAAGNILKLLGRYDYLALDSWSRKKFSEIHKSGRKTSDNIIEKFYEPLGKWKGLFFWLDMTRDWYGKKFPF